MKKSIQNFKALQNRTFVKIIAVILFVVMCAGAFASLLGVVALVDDGFYNPGPGAANTDYYQSQLFYGVAGYHGREFSNQLMYYADAEDAMNDPNWYYYPGNTNVHYVIRQYSLPSVAQEFGGWTIDQSGNLTDDSGEVHRPSKIVKSDRSLPDVYSELTDKTAYPGHYDTEGLYGDNFFFIDLYVPSALKVNGDGFAETAALHIFLINHSVDLIVWLGEFALLAIGLFILLLWSAGHKRGHEGIYLNWFSKIPLDLLTGATILAIIVLLYFTFEPLSYFNFNLAAILLIVLCVLIAGLLALAFFISLAARFKAKKWWRNTLIYLWLWRALRFLWRKMVELFHMIPLVWRSVLVFLGAGCGELILLWGATEAFGFFIFLLFMYNIALLVGVIYLAYQMRILKSGGLELARGNLSYKTDTSKMFWEFKQHGENLNSISEGMEKAVIERLKSEQFKTELITNVSHDIKTPLTSIINYVDLLKKEHAEGGASAEYLEVLERQSARLKKLTEDLIEASKASSGVITVEKARYDVCELLRQALGEYSERLSDANISLIYTDPGRPLYALCDGRLMWRVFDNILGNIRKYAQSGTRAFVDVSAPEGEIRVTFKNTSREILNITAEELMERFVRGDRSRNTEGSGLGLSIARSLTELQGGSLRLELDGDLFKAIIALPQAQA
ncbi:MAG: hypothetical protein LBM18_03785 [Oscillospiraceae bacterium]|jgi:signal transduction histidine kinase|nr:hypothetical protein [Oscillospiraceae bacterium]